MIVLIMADFLMPETQQIIILNKLTENVCVN